MGRRSFSAEFKHEAVKLVLERGVTVAQGARDLGLHENVLRKWVKDAKANGAHAFLGRGKQRPDDAEISRLRRVVGWSMSHEMTAQLVTDALVMALWRRGKLRELVHHSDQGELTRPSSRQFRPQSPQRGL
ncbi:MAG: transposase [Gammaproteobacteria bacterium]|nr:transposase [Gammaproteobacteria bacterium]